MEKAEFRVRDILDAILLFLFYSKLVTLSNFGIFSVQFLEFIRSGTYSLEIESVNLVKKFLSFKYLKIL